MDHFTVSACDDDNPHMQEVWWQLEQCYSRTMKDHRDFEQIQDEAEQNEISQTKLQVLV